MTSASTNKRIDTASRIIKASPETIYQAFVDPKALVLWLPPKDMKGHLYEFDARNGGKYRMSLTYLDKNHLTQGKTTEHADFIKGRFMEFSPNKRVVQVVQFESDDPAFAGDMIMQWTLTAIPGGTKVTIVCENVPEGIKQEDHEVGLQSTLENLADYTAR